MSQRNLILRERITAIIGIVLLLVLIGLSYYYSISGQLLGLKYVPSPKSPDFMAKNLVVTDFNAQGEPTRQLLAQQAEHFSDGQMNASKAQLYSFSANRMPIHVVSDKAWSTDSLQTLELAGNVFLRQEADQKNPSITFKTEYLKGLLDEEFFETDKPVFMTRGLDTTSALHGMEYDNVSHTVELKGDVVSVFHPQERTSQPSKSR